MLPTHVFGICLLHILREGSVSTLWASRQGVKNLEARGTAGVVSFSPVRVLSSLLHVGCHTTSGTIDDDGTGAPRHYIKREGVDNILFETISRQRLHDTLRLL